PLRAGRVFGGRMSQADAIVVQLPDDERPTKWYNIQADLPEPLPPPKDPATGPSRIKALPGLLIGECLRQENSTQRWIDIPSESLAGLPTTIFWVRAVHDWKTQRRQFMRMYGATVHASPSSETATGRALLEKDPHHPGSLGIAVSEGLEDAGGDEKAIYCLGS